MNNQKNAVAYIRVSTDLQIDGFSIDGQLSEIKAYCNKHNISLNGVYKDEGISGTAMKNRVEFQRMLNDISKNDEIDTVIVWKLSRFSRNMADLTSVVERLENNNKSLICISEGLDTSLPMTKHMLYMTGIFSEMERNTIVENSKMGMKQRALKGLWNGGVVFGYESTKDKELRIVDKEAEIIRHIFELFTNENHGYRKIASYLNEKGIKTRKGSTWSINSVKPIIDNPIYAGYIRWGQHQDWSKKRRKGKQDEYVNSKGIHIPIISQDMWERSRKIRDARGQASEKIYEGDFLLTGLVRCPVCGASMISHRTKKSKDSTKYYRYYQCSAFFNKGKTVCKSNLIRAGEAEEYVLNRIKELVNSKEIVDAIIKKIENTNDVDTTHIEKELKSLKKELKNITIRKTETLELEYENKIDINTLSERLKFLDDKEKEVTTKINSIENELTAIENEIKINPTAIRTMLENFIDIFNMSNIEKKKLLLKSIIESISINKGDSARNRKIDKIKLYFEPQEVEALNFRKKFATTYDKVHP